MMIPSRKFFDQIHSELMLTAIFFLFFFELISDFVESVYALCLLNLSLNENAFALLFLFSPAVLLFSRKRFSDKLLVVFGELMIVCRVLESAMVLQAKMMVAGFGVGCFLIFFPVFLQKKIAGNEEQKSIRHGLGLAGALALSILFRTLGLSIDISGYGSFQWIGWLLAAVAAILTLGLLRQERRIKDKSCSETTPNDSYSGDLAGIEKSSSAWKIFGISFGLTSIFILIYFVLGSPAVISRWTEGNYIAITTIIILIVSLFVVFTVIKPDIFTRMKLWMVWLWNGLFVLTLLLTITLHQIKYPSNLSAYPLFVSQTSLMIQVPLIFMLILSPVILVDFILLSRELVKSNPGAGKLGQSFTLALFYFVLMIFAEVFTVTYEYIPIVGPFFRNKFWLPFLIIGLGIALPVIFVKRSSLVFKKATAGIKAKVVIVGVFGIVSAGTVISALILQPHFLKKTEEVKSIKILSYNIQQGYNKSGIKNLYGQLDVIREQDPDIIGLQESDACRISSGNIDVVRFMAKKLNMYSYFGPKTVTGTFGIALLSKYPIENASTFYMYSKGEQTAAIEALIKKGSKTLNLFVTHLGDFSDPSQILQQQAILDRIRGRNNVVLMGDFNFTPGTEQYNMTKCILNDCWLMGGSDDGGFNIETRIDHIFVSPGTQVLDCQYLGGSNSDHPAVVAVVRY